MNKRLLGHLYYQHLCLLLVWLPLQQRPQHRAKIQ